MSLAWFLPNGPGPGSGISQSAVSSGPGENRTWGEPLVPSPLRGSEYVILGPASNTCRANAALSHRKGIYLFIFLKKHRLKISS